MNATIGSDLLARTNVALDSMEDERAARIFAAIIDDVTWEHVAQVEQISVEEAQRIYEDACDELRAALESSARANPDRGIA